MSLVLQLLHSSQKIHRYFVHLCLIHGRIITERQNHMWRADNQNHVLDFFHACAQIFFALCIVVVLSIGGAVLFFYEGNFSLFVDDMFSEQSVETIDQWYNIIPHAVQNIYSKTLQSNENRDDVDTSSGIASTTENVGATGTTRVLDKKIAYNFATSSTTTYTAIAGLYPASQNTEQSRVPTPEVLKAIYITNWVAGRADLMGKLLDMISASDINAVVIDVKDYTGRIGFIPRDPVLLDIGVGEDRISDIDQLINELHSKGIYVIGRVSAFQDSFYVGKRPDLAVHSATNPGSVWRDYKGVAWLDTSSDEVWEYIARISAEAYMRGFDEINLDYVRFPSDGNMADMRFHGMQGRKKADVLEAFFAYMSSTLRSQYPDIVLSADVFGMVATNADDLGIGQVLEKVLPHMDFVYPMVYPSHYPAGWNGIASPATKPYYVVYTSMKKAADRAIAIGENPKKLKPWIQDFDIGAQYGVKEVHAQILAAYDAGLTGWLSWNASNVYTPNGYSSVDPEDFTGKQLVDPATGIEIGGQ